MHPFDYFWFLCRSFSQHYDIYYRLLIIPCHLSNDYIIARRFSRPLFACDQGRGWSISTRQSLIHPPSI